MNIAFALRFATRSLLLACISTHVAGLSNTQAETLNSFNPSDRIAIRATVQAQLKAVHTNDADRAFAYATVELQQKVGSPHVFMQMIPESYKPVHQPRAMFFRTRASATREFCDRYLQRYPTHRKAAPGANLHC